MRRAATTFLTTLALALTPLAVASGAGAPAPRPGAAGVGDPYFPLDGNGGYDVGHYGLTVSYDPGSDRLAGRAVIRARATQSLSRFDLDLVGLSVDAVAVDGVGARWSRTTHELRVTPHRALRAGRSFTVVVRYHGVPRLLDEPALGRSGVFTTDDGAIVIGQPHVAATWFPVNDHPSDKASYAVDVTVPRGLEAVSNGALVGRRTQGGRTTWSWRESAPMASYLATATVGQFRLKTYRSKGLSYLDALDPVLFQQPRPRTGGRYALSGGDDSGYKRLTRTIAVPAAGGHLGFEVTRNTEPGWDYFAVEARTAGADDWTTLPDTEGHSSTDTGNSCSGWQAIHPQLAHYQSVGDQGCTATGTTGAWNAATGASDGYEHWSVDLSAYAGKKVEVSLSVISDETVSYPGVWVDDIVGPAGRGSTSFEADGDPLDGWTLAPPPAGSLTGVPTWAVASRDPRPSVGDNAAAALSREPQVISFLTGVLGPYPFRQVGGIVDDDPGLGFALENQTRPIYSKDFFVTADPSNDSVVTHELAHQWTGDDLALERWRDIWLNEGFATYMEWLWSEDQGRGSADDIFASFSAIPADSPFWQLRIGDPGPDRLFDGAVYGRGAMTLHALRGRIGDAAFFRLLKQWTASHSGGNVTTAQFRRLAESISGQHLGAFFRTWLYTAGKPAGLPESSARRAGTPDVVTRLLRQPRR